MSKNYCLIDLPLELRFPIDYDEWRDPTLEDYEQELVIQIVTVMVKAWI